MCPWSTGNTAVNGFFDLSFLGSVETIRGDEGHTHYEYAVRSAFRPQPDIAKAASAPTKERLGSVTYTPALLGAQRPERLVFYPV